MLPKETDPMEADFGLRVCVSAVTQEGLSTDKYL